MLPETTTSPKSTLTAPPKPPTPTTALAPGFRFHPTDEELCSYYLKRKVCNKPVRFNAIAEVDIYKNEPWDLAGKASLKSRDQEWYFFSALDKKYGNGARMNRATGKGYWKATGKDREVRRDSQVIAMKKTLVFHSGRAPGGQRTDWVMHEYRLVDEELDKIGGSMMTDSYVLCRVFYKNNIGPPTGNRYAPFIEEEWEDGVASGDDPMNELMVGQETPEMNLLEQNIGGRWFTKLLSSSLQYMNDNHSTNKDVKIVTYSNGKDSRGGNEPPRETQNLLPVCKTEREDDCAPLCVLNTEAPFPLRQYKRRRHNNDVVLNHSNASDHSTGTTQDPCSSTTTTAATTVTDTMMTTNSATTMAVSALLEFSLMESLEPKQSPHFPPPPLNSSGIESAMPPSCMRLITDLQKEIHKISVDRETLKLEMMSAQAMINILQSRIDLLNKENEDLKRIIQKDAREGSATAPSCE